MSRCLNIATSGASAGRVFFDILPWLLVLVGVVVVGAAVIYFLRRAVNSGSGSPEGFTLHEVRRLHETGQLSEEEFERAKAAIIGRVSAQAATTPPDDGGSGEQEPG